MYLFVPPQTERAKLQSDEPGLCLGAGYVNTAMLEAVTHLCVCVLWESFIHSLLQVFRLILLKDDHCGSTLKPS